MKTYYSCRVAADPEIIGVRNGVTQAEISRPLGMGQPQFEQLIQFFSLPNYWSRLDPFAGVPAAFEHVKLLPNAALTDFMAFGPLLLACPFLLSPAAQRLLSRHTLPPHRLLPAVLYRGATAVATDYAVLYCPYFDYRVIDFAASSFYHQPRPDAFETLAFAACGDYEAFCQGKGLHDQPTAEALVLNDQVDPALDLLQLKRWGLYLSSRLWTAIQEAGLTGLQRNGSKEPQTLQSAPPERGTGSRF